MKTFVETWAAGLEAERVEHHQHEAELALHLGDMDTHRREMAAAEAALQRLQDEEWRSFARFAEAYMRSRMTPVQIATIFG